MELDSSGYVSIVSLIIFIPTLIANLVVCARHGFKSSSTWFCILFLCVLRISGAICHLLSFSNFSIGLLVAIAVLNSIGLSPLLLATLGVITRSIDCLTSGGQKVLNGRIVLLIRLLTIIPLILGVIGAYIVYSDAIRGVLGTPAIMKAAVVISAFAFLAICGAYACTIPHYRSLPSREKLATLAVGLALPLILIRIIYSLIGTFANNPKFSLYNGSVVIRVCMTVLEEALVSIIYVVLGFNLDKLQKQRTFKPQDRELKFKSEGYRLDDLY